MDVKEIREKKQELEKVICTSFSILTTTENTEEKIIKCKCGDYEN